MQCTWRRNDMSLLEYLRKSTDDGDILDWIKKPWRDLVLRAAHEAYVVAGGSLPYQYLRIQSPASRETVISAVLRNANLAAAGDCPPQLILTELE